MSNNTHQTTKRARSTASSLTSTTTTTTTHFVSGSKWRSFRNAVSSVVSFMLVTLPVGESYCHCQWIERAQLCFCWFCYKQMLACWFSGSFADDLLPRFTDSFLFMFGIWSVISLAGCCLVHWVLVLFSSTLTFCCFTLPLCSLVYLTLPYLCLSVFICA